MFACRGRLSRATPQDSIAEGEAVPGPGPGASRPWRCSVPTQAAVGCRLGLLSWP